MSQQDRAARFAGLHVQGAPLVLYNIWDAGSATTLAKAGAPAVATSSWSVSEAQGYRDGEGIPVDFLTQIVGRIVDSVEVPVSADFEGGYTEDDGRLAENTLRLLDTGVVGINFEDRVVQGARLYPIDRQASRIAVIRQAADQRGVPLFINARTDLFLGQGNDPESVTDEAIDRAKAYADAGASGFFIPGLQEKSLIARISEGAPLPVNVMVMDGVPSNAQLAEIGVARISYGNAPYVDVLRSLEHGFLKLH
ncbi:2-Methylisocitrate lyase and related enzymes, PEP mutase family [Mycobacterium numidiamassiliense]|uniref:2-Methylisocitrate lyase and related enzymes, PEP mutase family n=1 Tax=Mycobacterium numidiamassiliense TaxID=1841861 RepID=A0A2U3PHG5_9MYCO|nr:isocitrate lyase/phosphoenolpyruvate mutase family protein [Mycobacterium numidiamassiliense]SPM43217.1 2-Methylisocitrate lyase and related enzymes, PEP mutase family [Mycobacterium numidiamassiliense]